MWKIWKNLYRKGFVKIMMEMDFRNRDLEKTQEKKNF